MLFPVGLMQRIVIKNMTEDVLSNIEISHNGEGNYATNIRKIFPKEEQTTQIYTLKTEDECDLMLTYKYKEKNKTRVVYDKLNGLNKPLITLEISENNGELDVTTIIDDSE